jgi:hypothetical protein
MRALIASFFSLTLLACSGSDRVTATIPNSGFLGVYAERMEKDVLPLLRSPELKAALKNPSVNARRFANASKLYIETTADVWATFEPSAKNEPCVLAPGSVMDVVGMELTPKGRFLCIQEVGIYALEFTGNLGEKTRGLDSGGNKIYVGDTVLLTTSEDELDIFGRPNSMPDGCAENSDQWGFFSLNGKSTLPGAVGLTGQPHYCVDGKVILMMREVTAESIVVVCEQKDCVAAELLKRAATKGASSSAQTNVSTAPAPPTLYPALRKKNQTLLGEWSPVEKDCSIKVGDKIGNLVIDKDGMQDGVTGFSRQFYPRIVCPTYFKGSYDIEGRRPNFANLPRGTSAFSKLRDSTPDRKVFYTLQLQDNGNLIWHDDLDSSEVKEFKRCSMPAVPQVTPERDGAVEAVDWMAAVDGQERCP